MDDQAAFLAAVGIAGDAGLPTVERPRLAAPAAPGPRTRWLAEVRRARAMANAAAVRAAEQLGPRLAELPGDHGGPLYPGGGGEVIVESEEFGVPTDARWPDDGLAAAVAAPIDPVVPHPDAVRDTIAATLFRPAEPHGALIMVHGGGWWMGDGRARERLGAEQARAIAAGSGWAVLDIDVRLAPEHPYPLPVFDVLAALDRVAGRDDLGPRVALLGISSGAHTVAVATLMAAHQGRRVDGQALIVPSLDLATLGPANDADDAARAARWDQLQGVFGLPTPEQARELVGISPLASPVLIDPRLARVAPPTMIATGEYDEAVVGGEAYAAELAGAGVPVLAGSYVRSHTLSTPAESRRLHTDLARWLNTL